MKQNAVLKRLKAAADPSAAEGMKRFGIHANSALGISVPALRKMAREVGRDHALAQELWESRIHEARILAAFVGVPQVLTERQMETWVTQINSWDICDACCGNLFDKTPFAYRKAVEWGRRREEFVKRAGFVLMAELAVHDKSASDDKFLRFLPLIRRESIDERNFVKKAVNWALRQIGKRNLRLNEAAIAMGQEIRKMRSSSFSFIAANAIGLLTSEAVQNRLQRKS
jgi:3-methyladenine DNA glycosylase AlkD